MTTALGMALTAIRSVDPKWGEITLRVRRGKKSAWLVSSDGRKVAPPVTITFKVPLTKKLRQRTGLKKSPQLIKVTDSRLLFCNGTTVPLVELELSVRLHVA